MAYVRHETAKVGNAQRGLMFGHIFVAAKPRRQQQHLAAAGVSPMALTLDVATVARRWTSADFERKPRSGDRSYEVSLAKVTAIGLTPAARCFHHFVATECQKITPNRYLSPVSYLDRPNFRDESSFRICVHSRRRASALLKTPYRNISLISKRNSASRVKVPSRISRVFSDCCTKTFRIVHY